MPAVTPLYHFLCAPPQFWSVFASNCQHMLLLFGGLPEGYCTCFAPHAWRPDMSGNLHPPLGTGKSVTACGSSKSCLIRAGMCRGVTNPPVPPAGRAQNHILAWLAPGLILLLWLLHWFPSKEILNMSLVHSLYLRVCSGNPDLLTFEQSGASGKAEFSILYGQGRENL